MTTRHDREKKKSQNDLNTQILNDMLQLPENKICAECHQKGPRWASWNLGIFLCIRCSGIHRNLGVHISKVRSVNLDTWDPEWIKSMQQWGNYRASLQWEFHLPKEFKRPAGSDQDMEQFIRAKYQFNKYKRKSSDPPLPEPGSSASVSAPTANDEMRLKNDKIHQHAAHHHRSENTFSHKQHHPHGSPTTHRVVQVQPKPAGPASNNTMDLLVDFAAPAPAPAKKPTPTLSHEAFFLQQDAAPSAPVSQPAPTHPPQMSKDDIMALFTTPSIPAQTSTNPFGAFPPQQQQFVPQPQSFNPFGQPMYGASQTQTQFSPFYPQQQPQHQFQHFSMQSPPVMNSQPNNLGATFNASLWK